MHVRSLLNWFDQRSLRAKIVAGFAALITLTLAVGGISFAGQWRTLQAMQALLERDNRVNELSLKSSATMLKARRYEKEFLIKVREFDYGEAKSRYATLVQFNLATVREDMATIRSLTDNADIAQQTRAIEQVASRYEAGFLQVVDLYGRLGRRDTGLEGQFRDRIHAVEALLQQGAPESLMAAMLTLRRNEKDYLLRGLTVYVERFESNISQFNQLVTRSTLPLPRKAQLLQFTQEYQNLFLAYVALDGQIEASSIAYLEAVHAVEPMLEQLHQQAEQIETATRASLQQQSMATLWTVSGVSLVAMLLGLAAVVVVISRNVNRSLRACVDFAGNVADGDLDSRLRPGGSNEFGVLTASLNRMADALQSGHRRDQERVLQLGHLNRTLRVQSLCNEALVRAENESDLLQAICNHVVQTGGYPVAWVGLACHDEDKSIRPAACAGAACDYVDALHLTWGEDAGRRGAGGAAIRDSKPVVVRDVATDPVFAPWRAAALDSGFASCIALPLKSKNGILGTLSIYASQADAFDTEEVKLLVELSDDLAYGIASLREIDERKRFERELAHRTHFDVSTGLANRVTFETRLEQALANARRQDNKAAILFIGLDRFKTINDSLGHGVGDRVLIEVAQRLSNAVRESDTVARLGSDEFAIFLTNVETAAQAAAIAGKIVARIGAPLHVESHEIRPAASIGISLFPDDGENVEALMKSADTAKHHAKSLGGSTYRFYASEMNARVAARFGLEADLRRALERGELMVHYQPQVSLGSGKLTGAEALIRWRHPDRGMISPAEFIPLAEETGLIQAIGEWVIDHVCAQLRTWLDAGLPLPAVAVNLSARQFHQESLVQLVRQALERNHLEPKLLELEITESAVMHDVAAAVNTLQKLKALGVRLSLDDFGTGYSSLSYLKRFPIDHLKIDQSFVREVTTDPDDAAICIAVIGLAHNLGLTVIAEGVETEAQMHYLRRQHCDEMQGYYFSRPLPALEFAQLLADDKTLALPITNDTQRTVLIVDDEPIVLAALTRVLRGDGYHILSAGNAQQGLELLAQHTVQVVLSDQQMPGMNGTEFLSKVKELHPNTLRVILSGYAELDSVIDAINRGAIYRFFTKPWDDHLLRENVREVFRHHSLLHRPSDVAPVAVDAIATPTA